jgi:hypothetical protein
MFIATSIRAVAICGYDHIVPVAASMCLRLEHVQFSCESCTHWV